jgi:hypothetical protein
MNKDFKNSYFNLNSTFLTRLQVEQRDETQKSAGYKAINKKSVYPQALETKNESLSSESSLERGRQTEYMNLKNMVKNAICKIKSQFKN